MDSTFLSSKSVKFLVVVALLAGLLGVAPQARAQAATPITVAKAANPNLVLIGQPLTFTIDVGPASPSTDALVIVTDFVPTGVKVIGATLTATDPSGTATAPCEVTASTVFCDRTSIFGSAALFFGPRTERITIEATAQQCGLFTNTAEVQDAITDITVPVSADFVVVGCPTSPTAATTAAPTAAVATTAAPTTAAQCPPASQGLAERSTTGNVADTFTANSAGDNSDQTAAPLQFGNSGPQQNAQGVLQECGSQSGDIGLQGGSMNFSPTLDAPSNQEVGQSSGASGQ